MGFNKRLTAHAFPPVTCHERLQARAKTKMEQREIVKLKRDVLSDVTVEMMKLQDEFIIVSVEQMLEIMKTLSENYGK